jgi:hypothetical protein
MPSSSFSFFLSPIVAKKALGVRIEDNSRAVLSWLQLMPAQLFVAYLQIRRKDILHALGFQQGSPTPQPQRLFCWGNAQLFCEQGLQHPHCELPYIRALGEKGLPRNAHALQAQLKLRHRCGEIRHDYAVDAGWALKLGAASSLVLGFFRAFGATATLA